MNHMQNQPVILEQHQRLSQSRLWQWQRRFFEQQGAAAWSRGIVPHYVTNTPTIARAYAQLIFAWLRDRADASALDSRQPLYIVELGAGAGRLAYHFLRAFFTILDQSTLRGLPVTYVLTDYSPRTLDFWQAHPQLQPWVAVGRLDFAQFDGEQDSDLQLVHRQETLSPATLGNPVAWIANYFFDGLTQDAFILEDGELYETLVTLTAPQPAPELRQIRVQYERGPIAGEPYADPVFNRLLERYRGVPGSGHLLFPIGALRCLRTLSALSREQFLLIAGDKGFHQIADVIRPIPPEVIVHGSFSLTVNYHALAAYLAERGGSALFPDHPHDSLNIALLEQNTSGGAGLETRRAYRESIEQGGPDDFAALKKGLAPQARNLTPAQWLAWLRLSQWDSSVFLDGLYSLLAQLPETPDDIKEEIGRAVYRIWDGYYFIGEEADLPFALGMVLLVLDRGAEARNFFGHSLRLHGPESSTYFQHGLWDYTLRRLDLAVTSIDETRRLNAAVEAARALKRELPPSS